MAANTLSILTPSVNNLCTRIFVRAAGLDCPLDAFHSFFLDGKPFIGGGDGPSIADLRLAATLEFLRAIDYEFPAWAEEYMARVEEALGDAYSEPAADVRGYVEQVKSAAVTA